MKIDERSPSSSRDVAKRTMRPGRAYVICSPKNGFCEVRLESWLEQSVAHALELDPRVSSYRAQPFTLNLTTSEILIKKPKQKPKNAVYYTPDLVADVDGMQTMIEAKPERYVEEHSALFAQVKAVALSRGMRFLVVTEENLRGNFPRNAQILNQYLAQARTSLPRWSDALRQQGEANLSGIARKVLQGLKPVNYYVMAGILSGQIYVDLFECALEDKDLVIQPAWGSLEAFEVLNYA